MRLRDHFLGYSLEMRSRLRPDEIERRINQAAVSQLAPFKTGIAGWARFGRIRLRYRPSRFFDYGGSPILAGRIHADSLPVRLTLRYRAPIPVSLFFALWYGIILLSLSMMLAEGVFSEFSIDEAAISGGMLLFFFIAPIAMHYLATRRADANFDLLVRFVEEHAEATIISGGRRRLP